MAATITKSRGGKPDKLVRDALLAAIRQEPERLKRIAERWLSKAEEGDQAAINALADRIDGKADSLVNVIHDGSITHEHGAISSTLEWLKTVDGKREDIAPPQPVLN